MVVLLTVLLLLADARFSLGSTFTDSLKAGIIKTDEAIQALSDRWKIPEYPNFLRSVAMPHSSWDVLRSYDMNLNLAINGILG
jgi:hypothetical protein